MLWLVVGVVLIRGAGATFSPADEARQPRTQRALAAAVWPDEAARALAVEFATAYLTHAPGEDSTVAGRRLAALAASDLAGQLAPQFDHDAPAQAVRSATVERAVSVDARHALITVAATVVTDGEPGTRRLTVPVARDDAGRLVVDELPSFASAPARAEHPAAGGRAADRRGPRRDRGRAHEVPALLPGRRHGRAGVPDRARDADRRRGGALRAALGPDPQHARHAGSAGRGQRVVLVTAHARDIESGGCTCCATGSRSCGGIAGTWPSSTRKGQGDEPASACAMSSWPSGRRRVMGRRSPSSPPLPARDRGDDPLDRVRWRLGGRAPGGADRALSGLPRLPAGPWSLRAVRERLYPQPRAEPARPRAPPVTARA